MYDYILLFAGAVIVITGIVSTVNPKLCTKKALRGNATAVAKIKKLGVLYIILGIIMVILGLFTAKII